MTTHNASEKSSVHQPLLRIDQPEELLAYVAHALGYVPENSLVCIAQRNQHLGAVLRCELPPATLPLVDQECAVSMDYRVRGLNSIQANQVVKYADQVATALRNDAEATSCLLIFFVDEATVEDRHLEDVVEQMAAIISEPMKALDIPVSSKWLVSKGRLWHISCGHEECLTKATKLGGIKNNRVSLFLESTGQKLGQPPHKQSLPLPSNEVRPKSYQDETEVTTDFANPSEVSAFARWLLLWNEYLDSESTVDIDEDIQQRLISGMEEKWRRDSVMAVAALGFEGGVSGLLGLDTIPPLTGDLLEIVPRKSATEDCAEFIVGRGVVQPEWGRLDRFHQICWQLMPFSQGFAAAALGSVIAWIEWIRGRGSAAAVFAREILEFAPEYSLARLLEGVAASGLICPWATRKATAWSSRAA